ncbi:MAG: hypothetical protein WB471_08335 [Nocardioides sp.]|uniref:hypothetical protein n=1 Tax=Nocardioides sp. TaxID=35761 RepID=UPI002B27806F|nr:hypothetical protein [Nocardioides sp.]
MKNVREFFADRATTWWRGWRPLGLQVVVTLLVVLAAGAAWERGVAWRDAHEREQERSEVVEAAKKQVLGLITISAETTAEDLDELIAGATASFRDDLRAQAGRIRDEVIKNEVVATGEVVSTGVVSVEDDAATVIVAAKGSVDNLNTGEPEPRNYRLEVEFKQVDGMWLVSTLRFVA